MKMLKKAKIVNISLNSLKRNSPTIHLSHSNSQELLQNGTLSLQYLMNNCYEAIKIISNEKSKALNNEKRSQSRNTNEPFRPMKKTEKQSEIKMPLGIAESIQVILKKFIKAKAEEEQIISGNNSIKMKLLHKNKPLTNASLLRKNKENTFEMNCNKTEQDECYNFFSPSISHSAEKLQSKLQQYERQCLYYKEKVNQQSAMIAKLYAKEMMMRKKYHDEMLKIIRSKNILNIHQQFQKTLEETSSGKNLLNVLGTTIHKNSSSKKHFESQSIRSSQSIEETTGREALKSNKIKVQKHTASTEQFKRYNQKVQGISYVKSKEVLQSNSSEVTKQARLGDVKKKTVKKMELKKQLQELQKERQKAFDELNSITQKYESNMDSIDQKILQKLRLIRKQEQLLTDDELKMLKDEDFDFQAIQMYGFYDSSQLHHSQQIEAVQTIEDHS